LLSKALRREFGADLLAGIAIITSLLLGEYLAGTLVVLMLSGGEALEGFAINNASFALQALAKRLPSVVHRKLEAGMEAITLDQVKVGDLLLLYPHEVCPTDGIVIEGHGTMDEAYLTGEPFEISKTPGSGVISGAINGESVLTIRATKLAADSRYAKIMQVMRTAEQQRPKLRRLGDQLGAFYTPVALSIAAITWVITGDSLRFLSVLVVATPCPLLIGIPVSIIGAISLAAKRGIIIRNPAIMEQINHCETMILDKTGTLTYGTPDLTELFVADGGREQDLLQIAATMEQYSKHPLAQALVDAAKKRGILLKAASEVSEPPGRGLVGIVDGKRITITSRSALLDLLPKSEHMLPPVSSGLECVVVIDNAYAGTLRFHDGPRPDSRPFVEHLGKKHRFRKVMLVSGDRETEVRYLAELVGIREIYFSQSPEEKVAIVRREMQSSAVVFVGDGINDAPALTAATVGVALGQRSDVTSEAAGAVIMGNSLVKVDELFHISQRLRRVALQSAVGGMTLSIVGMGFAAFGYLPAVAGAIMQEIIDVLAILNSLRTSVPPKKLTDF
jgi:heavy metal translocating P-type ATPase